MIKLLSAILFATTFSSFSFSQDRAAPVYAKNMIGLEIDMFSLPYEVEYIADVLVPETHAKRSELAPHYPDRTTLDRDETAIFQAYVDWVSQYPIEYSSYSAYLQDFLASHQSTQN